MIHPNICIFGRFWTNCGLLVKCAKVNFYQVKKLVFHYYVEVSIAAILLPLVFFMMFVWFMILCRPKQFLLGPIMARLMLRDLLRWHQATFIKSSYKQDPFQIASHTSLTTAFNQCLLQSLLKNVLLTWIQRLENKLKDKWFAKP